MYDRILIPTDGSDGMNLVIEHAVDLARVHDAQIDGIYVIDTASYASFSMDATWQGIDELLRDEGEAALEAIESAASGHVPYQTTILKGSPSRRIVQYSETEGCDLIVMGTHGRGGIDRLLLGSVAERVVRCSEVPVLTVRVGDTDEA